MKRAMHIWGMICLLLLWGGVFVLAQNTPGLNLGGTGTSSTQTAGAIPYVGSGTNALSFSSITNTHFLRSGGTGAVTGLDLFGTANTWSASQAFNGGITSTGTVNLTSGTLRTPNSTTLPGSCAAGDQYFDTDATSGQRFYVCDSANTWKIATGSNAGVFLIADDFYDAVNPGTAPAIGTSDTKFALFAARYAMMQLGSSTGAATPLPAGTIKFWSLDVTDNDATCVFTATLQIDKVDSGTYTCTMTDLSTARRQCFVSSNTTITAGQNVRMKYTTGSTCNATAYQRPVATLYVLPD